MDAVERRFHLLVAGAGLAVAAGVAAAIVLAFAGSSKAGPTKAEYFARMAIVCRSYGARLDRIPPPIDLAIPGDVISQVSRALPVLEAQERSLRALRPPKELRARIEQWLGLLVRRNQGLAEARRSARRPDLGGMGRGWGQFFESKARASALARRIGVPNPC